MMCKQTSTPDARMAASAMCGLAVESRSLNSKFVKTPLLAGCSGSRMGASLFPIPQIWYAPARRQARRRQADAVLVSQAVWLPACQGPTYLPSSRAAACGRSWAWGS